MAADYFDATMLNRQRLIWAVATRRQLERWEPLLASAVLDGFANRQPADADVWSAEVERHLALVAARNLLRALKRPPPSTVVLDATVQSELIEGRNLVEHWVENMPVFNVSPAPRKPSHPSGKNFAERNPGRDPYGRGEWSNKTGARLLPNVTALAVHQLLDDVEAEVLASDPSLAAYFPPRAPSPWLHEGGEWWPKPEGLDAA